MLLAAEAGAVFYFILSRKVWPGAGSLVCVGGSALYSYNLPRHDSAADDDPIQPPQGPPANARERERDRERERTKKKEKNHALVYFFTKKMDKIIIIIMIVSKVERSVLLEKGKKKKKKIT